MSSSLDIGLITTSYRIKVYSSISRLCRWNVQWCLVGVWGADPSYYHITASTSPMLLLQRGQCRVRVSGLDIAHYTNCRPDSKLFGSNGIVRVLQILSWSYINIHKTQRSLLAHSPFRSPSRRTRYVFHRKQLSKMLKTTGRLSIQQCEYWCQSL